MSTELKLLWDRFAWTMTSLPTSYSLLSSKFYQLNVTGSFVTTFLRMTRLSSNITGSFVATFLRMTRLSSNVTGSFVATFLRMTRLSSNVARGI